MPSLGTTTTCGLHPPSHPTLAQRPTYGAPGSVALARSSHGWGATRGRSRTAGRSRNAGSPTGSTDVSSIRRTRAELRSGTQASRRRTPLWRRPQETSRRCRWSWAKTPTTDRGAAGPPVPLQPWTQMLEARPHRIEERPCRLLQPVGRRVPVVTQTRDRDRGAPGRPVRAMVGTAARRAPRGVGRARAPRTPGRRLASRP
jgi:hypothetical protein